MNINDIISAPRFATFQHAANGDNNLASKLYIWNRNLSMAFLADIAILEVALRNAMHKAATNHWGSHWYHASGIALDERSCGQLARAWNQLPKNVKERPLDIDVPDRLIAFCMFGFWTNLLDSGDHIGRPPRKVRVNYEEKTWPVFKRAFPGGRKEARSQREKIFQKTGQQVLEPAFTRSWVHSVCKNINDLRNRVAHHEPLINGFPLKGQNQRMSAEEGYEQCKMLARMLDENLALWLEANSNIAKILAENPLPQSDS